MGREGSDGRGVSPEAAVWTQQDPRLRLGVLNIAEEVKTGAEAAWSAFEVLMREIA